MHVIVSPVLLVTVASGAGMEETRSLRDDPAAAHGFSSNSNLKCFFRPCRPALEWHPRDVRSEPRGRL
jgi:hypothetical protein